jgi:hypothetical protein
MGVLPKIIFDKDAVKLENKEEFICMYEKFKVFVNYGKKEVNYKIQLTSLRILFLNKDDKNRSESYFASLYEVPVEEIQREKKTLGDETVHVYIKNTKLKVSVTGFLY